MALNKKKKNIKTISSSAGNTRENHLIDDSTPFAVLEAYKAARTNLMFKLSNESMKNSVVFTSYSPLDGKSTTCLNMAITFAQTGAKVLIIDADLRKPTAHKYLNTKSKPGLSDKLGGLVSDELCIYRTSYDSLFLMPAGTLPPNPTELLISSNLEKLLDTISPLFDYIFIDTPPIGLVTDAAIVGEKTGGVVFVLRGGETRTEFVDYTIKALEKAGANLIGCVLNAFESEKSIYKYRRYKGYYRYKYGGKYKYEYEYSYLDRKENADYKD